MADLLDAGVLTLCNLTNTAVLGDMARYKLVPVISQFFGERQIGINRAYLAKGADEQVDLLARIWDEGVRPKIGQYAVITKYRYQENPDGDQYRITLVQPTKNEDGLRVFDLQLMRIEENYDCISE